MYRVPIAAPLGFGWIAKEGDIICRRALGMEVLYSHIQGADLDS